MSTAPGQAGAHCSGRRSMGPGFRRGGASMGSMFDSNLARDRPRLPPVIGHRGAAARAPENTLAGLRRAHALGCRWVEFDVRLTADGVPVLCHDSRLDRTTDGTGVIAEETLAAVRRCDAGLRFSPEFAGEPVPTLAEALSLAVEF